VKKVLIALLVFTMGFTLAACPEDEDVEIAMITDYGDIDDESFNQGTWEGIVEYAEEHGIEYGYYRPAEVSDAEYLASIDMAVEEGADIIITPGFLFEQAVWEAQYEYPDVKFVLLDGEPRETEESDPDVADNTVGVYYEEHESGFLAGYGAVREGLTDLGYMGGIAVPAVVDFGIGFIAGAYYAAAKEDAELNFPDDRYTFLGSFDPSDEYESQADGWYGGGTEVIFAAAGGAGTSIMSAAGANDAWMIGVDVDQSAESDTVLTSAMKDLAGSVQLILDEYYDDNFPGGETRHLGADQDGVGLPVEREDDIDPWRFETFTVEQYENIFDQIADGSVVVPDSYADLLDFIDENDLDAIDIEEDTVEP